jgi:methylglyoxal synthase
LKKTIALVAHDSKKKDMVEWVKWNSEKLIPHSLVATGTTGRLVEEALKEKHPDLEIDIKRLLSGPVGGDFQLGALIVEGKIDLLIFLWDAKETQGHDLDIKALLRISVLHNLPLACNRSSSDFMIESALFSEESYIPQKTDFEEHNNREILLTPLEETETSN